MITIDGSLGEGGGQILRTSLALALVTRDEGTDAAIAWTYVGFRVVHSVFQATVNKIEVRFALFFLSSLVLAAMTARAALAVWS